MRWIQDVTLLQKAQSPPGLGLGGLGLGVGARVGVGFWVGGGRRPMVEDQRSWRGEIGGTDWRTATAVGQ